jgi:hypothetical protein
MSFHLKMIRYYLLLAKSIKNGYQSPADIANAKFSPDVLNKEKKDIKPVKKPDLNMSVPLAEKSRDSAIKSQPTKIGVRTMSNDYNTPSSNLRQSLINATSPPADLINANHQKIETRTKKPNLAHLNNTTLMSIDDTTNNGHR